MDSFVSDFQQPYQALPQDIEQARILAELARRPVTGSELVMLKATSSFTDDQMADWLNMNVKTFRTYKQPGMELKINLQEHVLLLLSLFRHGAQVFGSQPAFDSWLKQPNYALGQQAPMQYLNTISGIQLLGDHLIGMAYGDNV